jgi:hypothetical protein
MKRKKPPGKLLGRIPLPRKRGGPHGTGKERRVTAESGKGNM